MRYRMEVIEDELIIRNVDMDIKLGTVVPIYADGPAIDPQRSIIRVLHRPQQRWRGDRHKIAVPNPLGKAAVVIANLRGTLRLSRASGGG